MVDERSGGRLSSCSLSDSALKNEGAWHDVTGKSGALGGLGSRALVPSTGESSLSDAERSVTCQKSNSAAVIGTGRVWQY